LQQAVLAGALLNGGDMSKEIRERLSNVYAAFKTGHSDFVLNSFHENIEYISHAPTEWFPQLGHRRGKASFAELLQAVHNDFEIFSFEPNFMVIEADRAAVHIFARFARRPTGQSVQVAICHLIQFRGGQIVELRAFWDSYSVAKQMFGTEIAATRRG
jgi:ketosteroid isomerase-like protein